MNELVARVKGMILAPEQEWRAIQAEPVELVPLFTRYVMILAAIPAIAGMLLMMLLGSFFGAIANAVVSYALALLGVIVMAKIIEALAPSFGGPQDGQAALKLAAFYPTAAWVAGGAVIIPVLGGLVALAGALYALYTLYRGVPIVMRVPQEKALVFTLAVIGVAIAVLIGIHVIKGIFI